MTRSLNPRKLVHKNKNEIQVKWGETAREIAFVSVFWIIMIITIITHLDVFQFFLGDLELLKEFRDRNTAWISLCQFRYLKKKIQL